MSTYLLLFRLIISWLFATLVLRSESSYHWYEDAWRGFLSFLNRRTHTLFPSRKHSDKQLKLE